jgi:hypothetical protein
VLSEQQYKDMVDQIGRMNLLAILGGQVIRMSKGVRLPVSSGISVVIELNGNDTYTVKRASSCARFGAVETIYDHGQRTEVYCEQLAETAYVASCYKSYDKGHAWVDEAASRV